eukprot:9472200-Pyramimonas_sp.AAC.1
MADEPVEIVPYLQQSGFLEEVELTLGCAVAITQSATRVQFPVCAGSASSVANRSQTHLARGRPLFATQHVT